MLRANVNRCSRRQKRKSARWWHSAWTRSLAALRPRLILSRLWPRQFAKSKNSMKLTVSNYAELLDEVTPPDAKGKVIPERIAKFLALVRKNRAWSQLPRIISAYETS